MFRVKICGITSTQDALVAAAAGADAIGLNFYPKSPRYCSWEVARRIAAEVPPAICKVGVFVNAPAEEVRQTAADIGLDLVQLHGDEPPERLRELRPLPVMRAFRVDGQLAGIAEYLQTCYRSGGTPRLVLIDALRVGQYGGTGATADWPAIARARRELCGAPLVLAGGLTSENVAAAIEAVRPWAVDTASGVEASPGKKSDELVRRFVAEAKAAFAAVSQRRAGAP